MIHLYIMHVPYISMILISIHLTCSSCSMVVDSGSSSFYFSLYGSLYDILNNVALLVSYGITIMACPRYLIFFSRIMAKNSFKIM